MKKAILVSLLVSVLAGSVFAQVTFSGTAYAGIQFQNPVGDGETITTTHREGYSPRFNLAAAVMRENYGARLDTTFQMTDDPEGHFSLNGIYGWVDFLDNSLRLTMGQISSAAWVTRLHARLSEYYFDKIRGFRVVYDTPLQGLSVGAAFRSEGHDLQAFSEQMIFGATFIHPLFSAVFAYDLGRNVQTLFGFNFTGIPDLTAGLQLRATRLVSWDDPEYGFPGMLEMHQVIGYRIMRPLNVYLILSQTFHGAADSDVGLGFTAGVEYRILPNLTGSFGVIIDSPDHFTTTNLTLNPMLEYTLRGPAVLYLEYVLRLDDMDRATHTLGFGITIRAF